MFRRSLGHDCALFSSIPLRGGSCVFLPDRTSKPTKLKGRVDKHSSDLLSLIDVAGRQLLSIFLLAQRCRPSEIIHVECAIIVRYRTAAAVVTFDHSRTISVGADKATYAGDLERDYGPDVQTFLRVFPSYPTSMTGLKKQIGEWTRQKIITDRRLEFWLEILPSLISKGFINKRSQTTT